MDLEATASHKTLVQSEDETSSGEMDSIYQLHHGGLGGYSDLYPGSDRSEAEQPESPVHAAVFMVGSTVGAGVTAVGATTSRVDPHPPPSAQVLVELMD